MSEHVAGSTSGLSGLQGLKVIDASTVLAAPLISSLMADFGADVIKLEQPVTGDPGRTFEPTVDGTSLSFKVTNRSKRSVTLDFHTPEGAAILYRLAAQADIVVTNFRPAKLREWRIDYNDLRAHNPALIMLHLTAFGRTGPYADKPGFARIAESFAGLTYITGYPDRPPIFTGYPLADGISGYYGAFATMVALEHRNRTGEGQLIDLALYEPVLRLMEDLVVGHAATGQVKERMGNGQAHVVPNNVYPTADNGWVVLPVSTASMWRRLVALIEDPELDGLDTNAQRLRAREKVDACITRFTTGYELGKLLALLEERGIAASTVNTAEDIATDEHIAHRGNLMSIHDTELDTDLVMQAPVPTFSSIAGTVRWPAPPLGAHTDEVLRDLAGCSPDDIDRLRRSGTI